MLPFVLLFDYGNEKQESSYDVSVYGNNNYILNKQTGNLFASGAAAFMGDNTVKYYITQIESNVHSCEIGFLSSWIIKKDKTVFILGNKSSIGLTGSTTSWFEITNLFSAVPEIWDNLFECKVQLGYNCIRVMTPLGSIYAIGTNTYGALGTGTTSSSTSFVKSGAVDAVRMESTERSVFYQNSTGQWFGCGDNTYGILGLGTTASRVNSYTAPVWTNAEAVSFSNRGIIYSLNGTLYSCGDKVNGQLGDGYTQSIDAARSTPYTIGTAFQIGKAITSATQASANVFIGKDNKFYGTGSIAAGINGSASAALSKVTALSASLPPDITYNDIITFNTGTVTFIQAKGQLYYVGRRTYIDNSSDVTTQFSVIGGLDN